MPLKTNPLKWMNTVESFKLLEIEKNVELFLSDLCKNAAFKIEVSIASPDKREQKVIYILVNQKNGEVRIACTVTNRSVMIHTITDWNSIKKAHVSWKNSIRDQIEENAHIVAGKSACRKSDLVWIFSTDTVNLKSMRNPSHTKDRFIVKFKCCKKCCV